MAYVEDDSALRAKQYARPLRYVYDPSINKKEGGGFRYVFEEGSLKCSKAAELGDRMCLVSRTEMSAIGRESPSFVYVDDGCWADDADGTGQPRRDFVLVCGPNVYLCEFNRSGIVRESNVESVQSFFKEMSAHGCRIHVLGYLRARDTLAKSTVSDPSLFLFLGDLHLPPVSWFYTDEEVAATSAIYEPPGWLLNLPALIRQTNNKMRNYYSCAQLSREHGRVRQAHGPIAGNPDIFKSAGADLVMFLNALIDLSPASKQLLHFIQTGDMYELWLSRDYQFRPGYFDPHWLDSESPNRVSNWALEVIIQNTPVVEAFKQLEHAGLAEVKYLWGNHDAYLGREAVTFQLDLPQHLPTFSARKGDLFCEHGHRFDRSNFDNTDYGFTSGPSVSKKVYQYPILREAEDFGREFTSIGHPSKQLDCHLLGATLIYLYQRYDLGKNPFSIYIMGHSHKHNLLRFNVRAEFHLYNGSG